MVIVQKQTDRLMVEFSQPELTMLHQSLNEILYEYRSGKIDKDFKVAEQFIQTEFERVDYLYTTAEATNFTKPIQLECSVTDIKNYRRILERALEIFEGELHARTGVNEDEARVLLKTLQDFTHN